MPALVFLRALSGPYWPRQSDQDTASLIDREALALNELVFERFYVRVIELKLQLEDPIGQATPLAQEGDRRSTTRQSPPRSPPCLVLGLRGCARVLMA